MRSRCAGHRGDIGQDIGKPPKMSGCSGFDQSHLPAPIRIAPGVGRFESQHDHECDPLVAAIRPGRLTLRWLPPFYLMLVFHFAYTRLRLAPIVSERQWTGRRGVAITMPATGKRSSSDPTTRS